MLILYWLLLICTYQFRLYKHCKRFLRGFLRFARHAPSRSVVLLFHNKHFQLQHIVIKNSPQTFSEWNTSCQSSNRPSYQQFTPKYIKFRLWAISKHPTCKVCFGNTCEECVFIREEPWRQFFLNEIMTVSQSELQAISFQPHLDDKTGVTKYLEITVLSDRTVISKWPYGITLPCKHNCFHWTCEWFDCNSCKLVCQGSPWPKMAPFITKRTDKFMTLSARTVK